MKLFSGADSKSVTKLVDVIEHRECMVHVRSASLLQDGATLQLVTCCKSFADSIDFYFRHSQSS